MSAIDELKEYERLRREERLEWQRKDHAIYQKQYNELRYWSRFWFILFVFTAIAYYGK